MYRQTGRLDRELIDWRAANVISDLYEEIYRHLGDHPVIATLQLVERLHSIRGAVHGLNIDVEPTHPDGLWADLRQLCEDAGWEKSRLQLAWAKTQRALEQRLEAREQRLEGTVMREAQEPRPGDSTVRGGQRPGIEDMGSIADQAFGEADL